MKPSRSPHIVQSPEWGEFKSAYGTPAVRAGNVQYTLHKLPGTNFNYAYCPKVNPHDIDFNLIKTSLTQNSCIAINFDVPNVIKGSEDAEEAENILKQRCAKAPKDTFARFNILLNIDKPENQLLAELHKKHRYNIRYAEKNGVYVKEAAGDEDFEIFYSLLRDTAQRQNYFIHPKPYYKMIWEMLHPPGIAHIVTAFHEDEPLASWMLFKYGDGLYYPYGGSSENKKNLFASNLVGWEAIKLGQGLGCNVFDMWGACKDLNDTSDPWWGFSNFKIKYGGTHVEYIDSYDLVLNPAVYTLFNSVNLMRWELLRLKARILK